MAVSITHTTAATAPDSGNGKISSNAWNEGHTITGLATVATSGLYSDIIGTPVLATVATSGAYADLSGKPALAAVATSGLASDVSGLATIATSGSASNLVAGTVPAAQMPALTGDVTTTIGAVATTIAANAVTFAKMQALSAGGKLLGSAVGNTSVAELTCGTGLTVATSTLRLANVANNTVKGNVSGSSATPTDLTAAQVITMLGLATVATSGLASDLTGTLAVAQLPALTGDVTTSAGSGATTVKALPGYTSGHYYVPDGVQLTAAGAALTVGTIYLTQGYIRHSVTIASLITRITTLGTGNCQISLYAADATTGDATGAPLFTSASQSTGAAGIVEVATSKALTPGWYWIGLQADNTTVIFESVNPACLGMENIGGLTASTNMIAVSNPVGLFKAGTFGTWPTLTGNRATDGFAEITSRCPAWGFKVA